MNKKEYEEENKEVRQFLANEKAKRDEINGAFFFLLFMILLFIASSLRD